jgi:hypothetical protein
MAVFTATQMWRLSRRRTRATAVPVDLAGEVPCPKKVGVHTVRRVWVAAHTEFPEKFRGHDSHLRGDAARIAVGMHGFDEAKKQRALKANPAPAAD